ncbi:MAG: amidohydrolase [Deltaproteobacteria bacterium]|nr:amidohydrolase [Deltaproteobacteria bacterium]
MSEIDKLTSDTDNREAQEAQAVVFRHGRILTLDPACPRASVLACLRGQITYVGDDFGLALSTLPHEAEVVDLRDRDVIPGLIDSHAHVLSEGLKLSQLDLAGLDYEETLEVVGEEANSRPSGSWIHGRGWDQNLWSIPWPTAKDLDGVSPHHPVVLDRIDKHSIWVNSQALKLAGLTKDTPDPEGGEFVRDDNGELTGVLIGKAMFMVYNVMPTDDGHDFLTTFRKAISELLGYGLTTLVDCATRPSDVPLIKKAVDEGLVKARLRLYLLTEPWLSELLDQGPVKHLSGDRLSIDGIKLFSDGSLGSRSAWLLENYADRPGYRGGHVHSDEHLEALLIRARDLGWQVAIHTIGDAAIAQTVKCMAQVLGPEKTERNWRLEHYQLVTDEDRERVISMGLIPSIQSVGLMTDLHMAKARLGPDRLRRAYAWRDIIDRGGYVINGSDCPIESPNPFLGIYAAVTRKDLKGFPPEGFGREQALSRLAALYSYTIWPAKAAFVSDKLGSLSPGKLCDFAVLDRDILTCPERAIAGTRVLSTVVNGELIAT